MHSCLGNTVMVTRRLLICTFAGALAAASLPLAVALVFMLSPEVALVSAATFAVFGGTAGSTVAEATT
jgi:hypothetical protein